VISALITFPSTDVRKTIQPETEVMPMHTTREDRTTVPKSAMVLSVRERLIYNRCADEFAIMAREYRESCAHSVKTLARASGVAVSRIVKFEAGEEVPSFPEVCALAQAYRIPVSHIRNRLQRLDAMLRGGDQDGGAQNAPSALPLTNNFCAHAMGFLRDVTPAEIEQLATQLREPDENIVDITIAEWPRIFPPTFGHAVLGECGALDLNIRMITACAGRGGAPVQMAITTPVGPPGKWFLKSGDLLDRSYDDLQRISARIEALLFRESKYREPRTDNSETHAPIAESATEPLSLTARVAVHVSQLRQAISLIDTVRPGGDGSAAGVLERLVIIKEKDVRKPEYQHTAPNLSATLFEAKALLEASANSLVEIATTEP
jgi:hypothetical protein